MIDMNELKKQDKLTIKKLFSQENVKEKFNEILGDKSKGFIMSVLQVANDSAYKDVDPFTVYNAAAVAATVDLPVSKSLGFCYIVPYRNQAQLIVGWKGLVQLALRSGQYKALNVINVYENQFKSFNVLTEELDADFSVDGEGEIVGFCAYMKLINGFEKTVYWSREKVEKHAKKFSKTYAFKNSVWKTDFEAMGRKTVIKNMLSKYGILSIEMQTAITVDQSVVKDSETLDVEYVDVSSDVPDTKLSSALDKAVSKSKQASLLDEIDNH